VKVSDGSLVYLDLARYQVNVIVNGLTAEEFNFLDISLDSLIGDLSLDENADHLSQEFSSIKDVTVWRCSDYVLICVGSYDMYEYIHMYLRRNIQPNRVEVRVV
jgi:hypothetical protein